MCYLKPYLLIFLVSFITNFSGAQVIDNTSTLQNITEDKYFRFFYDNDFFGNADHYYTQGVHFSYVHPALKKFPLSKVLLHLRNSATKWGVALDFYGYTPTSIKAPTILYGDRPYAGIISFQTFSTGIDTLRQQRLSSAVQIGVIGAAALGDEIQTGIHRAIDGVIPQGWKYQVKNDLVLNYKIMYEKKLLGWKNHFLLNGLGELRAGTLNTNVSTGANILAGNFKDPYKSTAFHIAKRKKLSYYVYGQSVLKFIGYDASLQGGLFNRKSVYTIPASNISRVTFQQTAGFAFSINKVYISYFKSWLTKEFSTGRRHAWGGIRVGVAL